MVVQWQGTWLQPKMDGGSIPSHASTQSGVVQSGKTSGSEPEDWGSNPCSRTKERT